LVQGDERTAAREDNLRVGGVIAEIEGLYAALLRTTRPARRARLLAQLSEAGARLNALSGEAAPRPPAHPRARIRQRATAAARAAAWITDRCSP
jgi:hypothetical protein